MVAAESTTRIADIKSRDSTAGVNRAPYARVKQHLKQGLASGRWPPGSLMPSEAELVAAFNVSRMTVNRALRELQAEGLVHRTQGVGTFAAQLHKVSSQLTINDLHDEIVARGHEHHVLMLGGPRGGSDPEREGVRPRLHPGDVHQARRADGGLARAPAEHEQQERGAAQRA